MVDTTSKWEDELERWLKRTGHSAAEPSLSSRVTQNAGMTGGRH
jgi:hypothetical protein